jgi:hypothetical protein
MELIIEKLKKIKELAERGFEGEASAAKGKLEILLTKYGLKIEDLEDVKVYEYKFKYVTVQERTIILQCISEVTDTPGLRYSHFKDKRKEFFVKLTEWQYVESKAMIDFHIKQFRKELKAQLDALTSAYCSKHRLFAASQKSGESKLTMEELARLVAIYNSLDDDAIFRKRLK